MDYDPKDLQSVLLYMRQKFGAGIFEEPPRMSAILKDLAPGLKRDENVLRQMSDAGLLRELRKVSESGNDYERVRAIVKSRGWLGDDYLTLTHERVEYLMTALQAVYGLEVEPPAPSKQAEAEPPTPPKVEPSKPPKAKDPSKRPVTLTPPKPNGIIIDSGITGDCIWTWDCNRVLTIYGQGATGRFSHIFLNNRPPYWHYNKSVEDVVIKHGVTSIGDSAFSDCSTLTDVTIPDSVTSIRDCAFLFCNSLTSVTIPDSVTSIGFHAFHGCDSLKEVVVPQQAKIDPDAFDQSTTVIREKTSNQPILPPTPTPPPTPTIKQSGNDRNVTWRLDNGKLIISGRGAIKAYRYNNAPWQQYSGDILSVIINDGITSIGDSAFKGCPNLKSVSIPDSVISIGQYAFKWCRKLRNVSISENTHFHPDAFDWSTTVMRKKPPKSTPQPKPIPPPNPKPAPKSTPIQQQKPRYNLNNQNPKQPPKPAIIDSGHTGDCTWTLDSNGVLTISGYGTISSIPCSSDEVYSLIIQNGVTKIGKWAFCGFHSLTSVQIPDSMRRIGKWAFHNCDKLTHISIPTKTVADMYTFDQHTAVTRHQPSKSPPQSVAPPKKTMPKPRPAPTPQPKRKLPSKYAIMELGHTGDCTWELDSKGVMTISGQGTMGNYRYSTPHDEPMNSPWVYRSGVIRSVVIKHGVTSVGKDAFKHCYNIESVIISDSVTSIGADAFSGCNSLTNIHIPASVTSIGNGAFSNCSHLTSIKIPDSVTSIGNEVFSGCSHLTSIEIPDSVTSVGNKAFSGCYHLKSVNIPTTAKIAENAFSKLVEVTRRPAPTRKVEPSIETSSDNAWTIWDSAPTQEVEPPIETTAKEQETQRVRKRATKKGWLKRLFGGSDKE